jgi:hypothetical protein
VKKWIPPAVWSSVLFIVLAAANLWMTRDAVLHGPLWYSDYGLYGMQYGARQVFEEAIPEMMAADKQTRFYVSSTWANGADTFVDFFLPREEQYRVQMLNVDYFLAQRRAQLDGNAVLVMTADEFERARSNPKFGAIEVVRTISYPNLAPGFYFARLAYSPDFDRIAAHEKAERVRPVESQVMVGGQVLLVSHSRLDAGQLSDLFDGDTFSLVRGLEANPLLLDVTFASPRPVSGIALDLGTMDFVITAQVYAGRDGTPQVFRQTFEGKGPDPHVELDFAGGPSPVGRIRIEIEQLHPPPDVHIHVRELQFK